MTEPLADAPVRFTTEGPISRLTLDRPEKLNALTIPMLERIDSALGEIDASHDIRVVVVTGTGERAFCAGADIEAFSKLEPLEMWRRWTRTGHRVMDRLAGLRQPSIAALNGIAYGGGLELALACDIRLAADHVQLAAPEVGVATIPGWGMTSRLAAIVGPARAKQLILTGKPIPAATAREWGLVAEVVPGGDLATATDELARQIAAQAPVSVQVAKQLIDGLRPQAAAGLETLGSGLAGFTTDAREGQAAFRERRPPDFKGS